jgi:hypothetical protein
MDGTKNLMSGVGEACSLLEEKKGWKQCTRSKCVRIT